MYFSLFEIRVTLWTVMITSRWHITWLAGQGDCSASLGEREQLVAVSTCCGTNEGRGREVKRILNFHRPFLFNRTPNLKSI